MAPSPEGWLPETKPPADQQARAHTWDRAARLAARWGSGRRRLSRGGGSGARVRGGRGIRTAIPLP
eukprot:9045425-Pyramimonas_sp.AAC.1